MSATANLAQNYLYNIMNIGDLVRWKEDGLPGMPAGYDNWQDIGVVVDWIDLDTVLVKWCSGEEFSVWCDDLEVISNIDDLTFD